MKHISLIILAMLITGCFSPKLYLYDRNIKNYLKNSKNFNTKYEKTNYTITYDFNKIEYKKDNKDLMRCPSWVINNNGGDCDSLAYFSTLYIIGMPFQYFMIFQGKRFGHVVAVYKQPNELYCIVTNLFQIRDQTIEAYIKTYCSEYEYVAIADINLNFKTSYIIDEVY